MRLTDVMACEKRLSTLTGDISNVFIHAPEDEEVYNQPPGEWYEENPEMVGMVRSEEGDEELLRSSWHVC